MSDENKEHSELELDHNYDGITELDNPLPSWWLWTFFITIIFSFLYYIHYELGGGPSLKTELTAAMVEIEKNKGKDANLMETEDTLVQAMNGTESAGANVFAEKCAACHGKELQGQIGPNLTDKYWIHGKGTRVDIVKVVREGVLEKGMPNWNQMLKKEEVYSVVAFILSKKGSNPANAKAPQGDAAE